MAVEQRTVTADELAALIQRRKSRARSSGATIWAAGPLARPTRQHVPLSFAQERLWFIHQLHPQNASYNVPMALRLQGELDAGVLEKALAEIICRHEILRTRFAVHSGKPVQVIDAPPQQLLAVRDLSQIPTERAIAEVKRVAQEEALVPFNLETGPVVRVGLMRLAHNHHVLLVTLHHIAGDGWSLNVLIKEFSVLYAAFRDGRKSPLPDLSIQYADYADWQRECLQGELLEKQLAYWRKQLARLPVLKLPIDSPRRPIAGTRPGERVPFRISADLTDAIRELCAREEITLFMVLMAGFSILMSRYSGQDGIAVGTDVANRNHRATEDLIGFFSNQLVMRCDLSGNPTLRELLNRLRRICLDAYAAQDVPFERIVEELNPARDLTSTPLFQAKLVLQNTQSESLRLPGLDLSSGGIEPETTKFDLTLFVEEGKDEIAGIVEYDASLFSRARIERMAGHITTLLNAITSNPEQRVSEAGFLTELEKSCIIGDWSRGKITIAAPQCAHKLFEEQVRRGPDAIALADEWEQISYQEVNRRANKLARYLRKFGAAPEIPIALCMHRSPAMVIAMLAILKAGGAYLPLDPSHPPDRLSFIIEDAHTPIILTQETLLERVRPRWEQPICLDRDWPQIEAESPGNPSSSCCPRNAAYILYTSGSTGSPKGVVVQHESLHNYLLWCAIAYPVAEGWGAPVHTPLAFDLTVTSLLAPLVNGGKVLLVTADSTTQNLSEALTENPGASLVKLTPAHLTMLLNSSGGWHPNMNCMVVGGEALPPAIVQACRSRAPAIRIFNEYGPTECTVGNCVFEVNSPAVSNDKAPIGRPIINTDIYVLDRFQQFTPQGVAGEIYIAGESLARGYINKSGLTAELFLPDPFAGSPGKRMYRTGDLGYWNEEGLIEFIGRRDSQLSIRGHRVEPAEIETVLQSCDDVEQAAVISRKDQSGSVQLVAFVSRKSNSVVTEDDLRGFLSVKLPSYMVPTGIEVLDELPLTSNAKVDRSALCLMETEKGTAASHQGPRTEIETIVCAIWADVLGVQQIGTDSNFFQTGGHSLLGTLLTSRVREVFGVDLPLRVLFDSPTVAAMAEEIEKLKNTFGGDRAPKLSAVERQEAAPSSFAQLRLWFMQQLEPRNPKYNIPMALRIKGEFNAWAAHQSLCRIIERHEVLRTHFAMRSDELVQIIEPELALAFQEWDVTDLSIEIAENHAKLLAENLAVQPFDLQCGPLLRAGLIKLAPEDHIFILAMHHIVSDGWSLNIFVREFGELYSALVTGRKPVLPHLPIQYSDFAIWQRQYLSGEILEQHLEYWKKTLQGARTTRIPADEMRLGKLSNKADLVEFSFGNELTSKINAICRAQNVTQFMTIMTAFQVLLGRYTGELDIVVGTDIANRNRREIEPLIGFFINQLVLRTELTPEMSLSALLNRVREIVLDAYKYQDLPFEKLVDELKPERVSTDTPLFQTKLVFQNLPASELRMPNVEWNLVTSGEKRAKLDLMLMINDGPGGLSGVAEYATDYFERTTIERLTAHLLIVLKQMVEHPEMQLREVSLLDEPERRQVLNTWNDTARSYGDVKSVLDLFDGQQEQQPDAVAMVCCESYLTYRTVYELSEQLACSLRRRGVKAESRVGLYVERSLEMVVGILGILKSGAAYLPLDPNYPEERLLWMLQDAGVSFLLLDDRFKIQFQHNQIECISLASVRHETPEAMLETDKTELHPENLAYVIYTSGSTGVPKGVCIEHRQLLNYVCAVSERLRFQPGWRMALISTFGADLGYTMLYPSLAFGGVLHIIDTETGRDPQEWQSYCEQHQIDCMKITPTHLQSLLTGIKEGGIPQNLLVLGGEASRLDWIEQLKTKSRQCVVANHYGPTECCVGATTTWMEGEHKSENAPIGRPLGNAHVFVVDRWNQALPVGVAGELQIGGAGVGRGYLNRPALTAERFIPDDFSGRAGARVYRTGDVAKWRANGELEFLGRTDDQIKIRGYRVELGEIECVLQSHPEVEQAVVIAGKDDRGETRIIAYVIRKDGAASDSIPGLIEYAKAKLQDYMVPSAIVTLTELPLTVTGKLDRKALPHPERGEMKEDYTAPRAGTEEILCQIWADILGVPRVGIHENFFELGGDSILAIQVVARAREAGVQISPSQMFDYQTVARLAAQTGNAVLLSDDSGDGIVPLTPIQCAFFARDPVNIHFYNQAVLLRLNRDVRHSFLERSAAELARRHGALRFRFNYDGERWIQQSYRSEETVSFSCRDFSELPEVFLGQAMEQDASQVQRSLNLSRGPLMRMVDYDLGRRGRRLLIVVHHLAIDGVSWRILLDELQRICEQLDGGNDLHLPPGSASFKRWAEHLTALAQGEELKSEIPYWCSAGSSVTEGLPVDHDSGANTIASTAVVSVNVTPEDTQHLLQVAPRMFRAQIIDILLAALSSAFSSWTGQKNLFVALEGHGREEIGERIDVSQTVGWFTSVFPILLPASVDGPVMRAVSRTRELLKNVPHRGCGYGVLRYLSEDAALKTRLAALPFPQVRFNYLGQFDQQFSKAGVFALAPESSGASQDPHNLREYLLEVGGIVSGGCLRFDWTYSTNFHRHETIEGLARAFSAQLRKISQACSVGGQEEIDYCPEDFPLAKLNDEKLRQLSVLIQ